MQTILGSGGDISIFLARELKNYTNKIRLVARHPQKINDDDELFSADLLHAAATDHAIKGSDIVYMTVGLAYDLKIWRKQWPVLMQNVIQSCVKHNAKLVFFDNVYMYAEDAIPNMSEESRIDPPSKKGQVRAHLVKMINDAIKTKGLIALIARCADFYGPGAKNGVFNILVVDNFKKGKKASWQSDVGKIHSLTFTPDAAKATAMLGNTESAYGQVWHLPTSTERLTGKDYINLTAKIMNVAPRYNVLTTFLFSVLGMFSKVLRELKEMQYQNNSDYFFDSKKFTTTFHFTPTKYEEGIKATINAKIK